MVFFPEFYDFLRSRQEFRVQACGFAFSDHRLREVFAEQDGELGLGHTPLTRRHGPLFFGAVQDQKQ